MVNQRTFFDVEIDKKSIGRVVFELFNDVTPKTCENFRCLCTGEKGLSDKTRQPLHFKGSRFHRIIKNFMIQGGDFTVGDGTGGESIYGKRFEDENFKLKHSEPYLLSMANAGPNSNGSQFFITTAPAPHLDGKHVVFGRVVGGKEVIDILNHIRTDPKLDKPYAEVTISHCGELVLKSTLHKKDQKIEISSSDTSPSDSSSSSEAEDLRKKKKKRNSKHSSKKRLSRKSSHQKSKNYTDDRDYDSTDSSDDDDSSDDSSEDERDKKRSSKKKHKKRGRSVSRSRSRSPNSKSDKRKGKHHRKSSKSRSRSRSSSVDLFRDRFKPRTTTTPPTQHTTLNNDWLNQPTLDKDGRVVKGRGAVKFHTKSPFNNNNNNQINYNRDRDRYNQDRLYNRDNNRDFDKRDERDREMRDDHRNNYHRSDSKFDDKQQSNKQPDHMIRDTRQEPKIQLEKKTKTQEEEEMELDRELEEYKKQNQENPNEEGEIN